MRISQFMVVITICTTGCATHTQSIRLSATDRQQLDQLCLSTGWARVSQQEAWPPVIRKLHPITLYFDVSNIVIVLSRDPHTERGLYIMPPASSYVQTGPGWRFTKELAAFAWEYERTIEPGTTLEPAGTAPFSSTKP